MTGKIGGALSFDGVDDLVTINGNWPMMGIYELPRTIGLHGFTLMKLVGRKCFYYLW